MGSGKHCYRNKCDMHRILIEFFLMNTVYKIQ